MSVAKKVLSESSACDFMVPGRNTTVSIEGNGSCTGRTFVFRLSAASLGDAESLSIRKGDDMTAPQGFRRLSRVFNPKASFAARLFVVSATFCELYSRSRFCGTLLPSLDGVDRVAAACTLCGVFSLDEAVNP